MASVELTSSSIATQRDADLIGTYHRIAGIGPGYQVLKILDERYAWICLYETDEEVRYRIEDIRLDPHPDDSAPDFAQFDTPKKVDANLTSALIGQRRKIGKFGPRYQVVSIASGTDAMIRLDASDEDTDYPISEILNDPVD
jgi:hypothetical protein